MSIPLKLVELYLTVSVRAPILSNCRTELNRV